MTSRACVPRTPARLALQLGVAFALMVALAGCDCSILRSGYPCRVDIPTVDRPSPDELARQADEAFAREVQRAYCADRPGACAARRPGAVRP